MPLAIIPDNVKSLPQRWLTLAEARRELTTTDAAADALEKAAAQLQREIAAAEEAGKMLTTSEFAELRRCTAGAVRKWCEKGQLPGAVKNDSGDWLIPATAARVRKTA
jgi:hypothetical protein